MSYEDILSNIFILRLFLHTLPQPPHCLNSSNLFLKFYTLIVFYQSCLNNNHCHSLYNRGIQIFLFWISYLPSFSTVQYSQTLQLQRYWHKYYFWTHSYRYRVLCMKFTADNTLPWNQNINLYYLYPWVVQNEFIYQRRYLSLIRLCFLRNAPIASQDNNLKKY